jgi:hypothetical protein
MMVFRVLESWRIETLATAKKSTLRRDSEETNAAAVKTSNLK